MRKTHKGIVGAIVAVLVVLLLFFALRPGGRRLLPQRGPSPRVVIDLPGQTAALAWSPDGRTLATGTRTMPANGAAKTAPRGQVQLWDAQTGTLQKTLSQNQGVFALAFSPDGKVLAGSGWRDVALWDAHTGRLLHSWTTGPHEGFGMAWSPDRQTLAVCSGKTVQLWDAASGHLRRTLTGRSYVYSVAWAPRGRLLASGTGDVLPSGTHGITLWDTNAGRPQRVLPAAEAEVAVFAPDGAQLAALGMRQGDVTVFDVRTGRRCWGRLHAVRSASGAFSPDGRLLAVANLQTVEIWNARTGSLVRSFALPEDTQSGYPFATGTVAWSPDGATLANRGVRTVKLWDVHGL